MLEGRLPQTDLAEMATAFFDDVDHVLSIANDSLTSVLGIETLQPEWEVCRRCKVRSPELVCFSCYSLPQTWIQRSLRSTNRPYKKRRPQQRRVAQGSMNRVDT